MFLTSTGFLASFALATLQSWHLEFAPAVYPGKATCLGVCSVEAPAKHARRRRRSAGADLGQCLSAGCMGGCAGAAPAIGRAASKPPRSRWCARLGILAAPQPCTQGANDGPMNTGTCRCTWHCHSPPFRAPVVLAGYRHCGLGLPLSHADARACRPGVRAYVAMAHDAAIPWPQLPATFTLFTVVCHLFATAGCPAGLPVARCLN